MRINKLLSNYGYCSRKEANVWIESNRIHVNGSPAFPGQWVEEEDDILLDGEKLKKKEKIYIAFHKPPGIICTRDESVEENIISFLHLPFYIFPVGRLDKESEGLILLTNDGDWANEILSSENNHEKEYLVTVDRPFKEQFLQDLSSGVDIRIGQTRPCTVEKVSEDTFRIILTQGLNRQIRRMTRALGYDVTALKRRRILNITWEGLSSGQWRHLLEDEKSTLRMVLKE
ncbi:pseudouridine synthase [Proteiniclasticum sp. C24MP]|uniref:pseudouridine synthase n=1 Tax=Proteiniclasticum sp. C24MP TaxID=3374101 RepID=UPI003753F6C3